MKTPVRYLLMVCVLMCGLMPAVNAMDDTLLGGSMTQHIKIWAAPRFSLESGFIYQVTTDLRLDQRVWVGFNHFAGYRNVHYQVDLFKKLSEVANADEMPDAAIMPLDLLLAMEKDLPVSYLPSSVFPSKKFNSEFIDPLKRGDQYLGVPIYDAGQLLLYYNKSLLPEPPKTWEDIVRHAELASMDEVQNITFPVADSRFFCAIAGCEAGMSSEDLATRLIRYKKFVESSNARLRCETSCPQEAEVEYCKSTCSRKPFFNNEAYMMIEGDWAIAEAKLHLEDNVGIMPLPAPLVGEQKHIRYPTVLVFFGDAMRGGRKNTTKQTIRYFVKKMNQRSGYFIGGLLPVHKKVRPKMIKNASTRIDLTSLNVQYLDSSELVNVNHQGWHPNHPEIDGVLEHILVDEIMPINLGAANIFDIIYQ